MLLFGFVVYFGIGKMMLLEVLLFKLIVIGLCIGLLKYVYYDFDVDKLGKDSYCLCKVGVF